MGRLVTLRHQTSMQLKRSGCEFRLEKKRSIFSYNVTINVRLSFQWHGLFWFVIRKALDKVLVLSFVCTHSERLLLGHQAYCIKLDTEHRSNSTKPHRNLLDRLSMVPKPPKRWQLWLISVFPSCTWHQMTSWKICGSGGNWLYIVKCLIKWFCCGITQST